VNPEEQDVLSFFPKVAYFNHSCSPSVTVEQVLSGAHLEGVVATIEDIPAGVEVTICYRPDLLLLPRQLRQATLKDLWGFECTCERCSRQDGGDEPFLVQTNLPPAKEAEAAEMFRNLEELFKTDWDLATGQKIKALSFLFLRILGNFHWQAIAVRKFLVEVLLTIAAYEQDPKESEKATRQVLQIVEQLFRCYAKALPRLASSKMTLLTTYLQHGGTLEAAAKLDPSIIKVQEIFSTIRK